jgi:oxygen-independent coproporphyrinogen-3 oxidase
MPERWLSRVAAEGHGMTGMEPVARDDQFSEALLMGLRLSEGVDLSDFQARFGKSLHPDRVDALVRQDLLHVVGNRLTTTAAGRLVLNAVLKSLLV